MSTPASDPLPETSPPRAAAEDVPDLSHQGVLLNRTPWDNGTLGHPDHWSSWRITTPYRQRIEHIFAGQTYIAVHEESKKGVEHWHALVAGIAGYEAIRKRIQRKLEYKGMLWWSNKDSGTFEKALAYTKKTVDNNGNTQFIKSDDWPDYNYTKWSFAVQTTIRTETADEKKARKESDWQLNYANLVTQAVRYYHASGLGTDTTLKTVVAHMMEHTKWRPSKQMITGGVPEFYSNDFLFRISEQPKKRKIDMSWWHSDGH